MDVQDSARKTNESVDGENHDERERIRIRNKLAKRKSRLKKRRERDSLLEAWEASVASGRATTTSANAGADDQFSALGTGEGIKCLQGADYNSSPACQPQSLVNQIYCQDGTKLPILEYSPLEERKDCTLQSTGSSHPIGIASQTPDWSSTRTSSTQGFEIRENPLLYSPSDHVVRNAPPQRLSTYAEQPAVNMSLSNSGGNHALHKSVEQGHMAGIKLLLDYGANVNSSTCDGLTPLHIAAQYGHDDVARYLLHRGADIDARDAFDRSPILIAAQNEHEMILKLLMYHEASEHRSV